MSSAYVIPLSLGRPGDYSVGVKKEQWQNIRPSGYRRAALTQI